jgi:hypothetical protein
MEVVLGIICGYYGADEDNKRYEIVKEQLSQEELNQLDEICTYVLADEQGYKTVSNRILKDDIPLLRKVYNIIDDNDLFKNSQGDYDWDAMSGFEKICLTSSRRTNMKKTIKSGRCIKSFKEKNMKQTIKSSAKWVEEVADAKGITFEQVLKVFEDNGYGEDEADDFWNSKWVDVDDAFGEDGILGLDELFGIEITSSRKLIKSGTSNFGSNDDIFGYSFPLVTFIAENYVYDEETDTETEERDYDADYYEYEDAIDNAKDLADEMGIPQYDDYSEY